MMFGSYSGGFRLYDEHDKTLGDLAGPSGNDVEETLSYYRIPAVINSSGYRRVGERKRGLIWEKGTLSAWGHMGCGLHDMVHRPGLAILANRRVSE